MHQAKNQWKFPESPVLTDEFRKLIQERGLSEAIAKLLWQRNIREPEALELFLNPQLTDLYDPFLFYDMDKVVVRLQQAIADGERILVYGDYDADGITSSTVMKEALELMGADVTVYLPNRFTDGYGPNLDVYRQQIESGIQLIVTVDNGVSGHAAIDFANSQGVDVIVTDHHELPAELPNAYGIIHPRHPKGHYPFGDLAGVGVAFKVACALLDEVPLEFMDLAAIGTIADMVSLTDENRVMVSIGLQMIKQTERIGLQELFRAAQSKITDVDETMIGFAISPRLNAVGRLGDPNPAVTLLTTFDEEEARQLAGSLNTINEERKALVAAITEEAMGMLDPNSPIHLVAGHNWHEGVLGIVAGRILRSTGKPAIVLTIKEDGICKGSGRSIEALNLYQMLDGMRDLFTSFGGHHAAVGLSLPQENLAELKQRIVDYLDEQKLDLTTGEELLIDGEVKVTDITLPFIESLAVLAPFGTDNPLPRFALKATGTTVLRQIGANQQHLKMAVVDDSSADALDVIGFDFGSEIEEFKGEAFTLVGEFAINEWNGVKKPQMQLVDFQVTGLQLFDFRGKKNVRLFNPTKATLLLAFNRLSRSLDSQFGESIYRYRGAEQLQQTLTADNYQEIAFLDCPEDPTLIKEVLQQAQINRVMFVLEAHDDAYLDGIGTREQYARLFKLIAVQPRLDIRNKLPEIAGYLHLPPKLLIFMIQVFFDLKFVTISDGVLQREPTAEKKALESSKLYASRLKKIKSEEFLLLSDLGTLKAWLTN